jgi:hypothetical protein
MTMTRVRRMAMKEATMVNREVQCDSNFAFLVVRFAECFELQISVNSY